jgi:beta-1,2-mannobiose phosphorylase / 1,2-beta-oligomannan phosphorylase
MEKTLLITKDDIVPSRPDFEVIGAFNPGSVQVGDETILLVRVAERPVQSDPDAYLVPVYDDIEDLVKVKRIPKNHPDYDFSDRRVIMNHDQNHLTSLSHFRLARSKDGKAFEIDTKPTVFPSNATESFGIEDPRITTIDGTHYISYTAIGRHGINGCLMWTDDFVSFHRMGIVFTSDNKDVVLFPKRINGAYHALHRPSSSEYGKLDIWLATSPDLSHWGKHQVLMERREGRFDDHRLGASAVPFLTERGWIEIYHAGDTTNAYALGAVLLDKDDPSKVLMRSSRPLIIPDRPYEMHGFFKNIVFSCGAIVDRDTVCVYYGASDESVACATLSLDEIFSNMEDVSEVVS